MKYATTLFCLVVAVATAKAASVGGRLNLDRNAASVIGALTFPRIPGINSPLGSSFLPSPPSRGPGGSSRASPRNNLLDLFDVPDPNSLISDLPSGANSSDISIPSIPELPDIAALSQIPGVSNAIQLARNKVQTALNLTSDISSGIEQAISEAFESNNPTAAVLTILRTIINSYVTVARNCPLLVVGSRVIQEGIRLAIEVARSASNVIFGNSTLTT